MSISIFCAMLSKNSLKTLFLVVCTAPLCSHGEISLTMPVIYKFEPSARDPFVSYLVVNTLVDTDEKVSNDTAFAVLEKDIRDFGAFLEEGFFIKGVSYGPSGGEMAIINDRALRAGGFLSVQLNEGQAKLIDKIAMSAQQAGYLPKIPFENTIVGIRVHKIDELGVHLRLDGIPVNMTIPYTRTTSNK